MLSRVADSLYWIGRYLERAEHTVRVLEVNMSLMLERSAMRSDVRWRRVLQALGNPPDVDIANIDQVVRALCFDPVNRGSIYACVSSARESARQVRDEISSEQWQKLNHLYHGMGEMQSSSHRGMISDSLQTILDGVHLFQGVTDTTMTHGEGWQFIRAGRHMERATQVATLLELYYRELFVHRDSIADASQYLEWVGLLRCCTAFEAYCTVYTADLTPARILEFLLLNGFFPHSLRYSVDSLVSAFAGIQLEGRRTPAEELTRRAGRLQASLSFVQIDEIIEQDAVVYLRNVLDQCRLIQELIYRIYISYSVDTALAM